MENRCFVVIIMIHYGNGTDRDTAHKTNDINLVTKTTF